MNQQTYEGVKMDRCPDCGAVWLDWKELGTIVQSRKADVKPTDELPDIQKAEDIKADKRCPECNQPLERFNYAVTSGVFLDRCPQKHGIWLDPGELQHVQAVMEELDREFDLDEPDEPATNPDVKRCPRCDVPLHQTTYEGLSLDRCGECGGMWTDGTELMTVVRKQQEIFTDDEFKQIRADEEAAVVVEEDDISDSYDCPTCGRTMNRVNYQYTSGIIIDNCPAGHGTWLDRNELQKIQIFSERWDDRAGEIATEYQGALQQAAQKTEREIAEDIQNSKVSRFGAVNRFFRMLSRKGWL
jgi:Zn-finger nucleic acid-binding protein